MAKGDMGSGFMPGERGGMPTPQYGQVNDQAPGFPQFMKQQKPGGLRVGMQGLGGLGSSMDLYRQNQPTQPTELNVGMGYKSPMQGGGNIDPRFKTMF